MAVDTRHPVFRPFNSPTSALGDVYIERYRRLNFEGGQQATVLARFAGAISPRLQKADLERGAS